MTVIGRASRWMIDVFLRTFVLFVSYIRKWNDWCIVLSLTVDKVAPSVWSKGCGHHPILALFQNLAPSTKTLTWKITNLTNPPTDHSPQLGETHLKSHSPDDLYHQSSIYIVHPKNHLSLQSQVFFDAIQNQDF